jgi:hypothetical protein
MPKMPKDDINLGDILFADNYIDGLVQVMQYAFSPGGIHDIEVRWLSQPIEYHTTKFKTMNGLRRPTEQELVMGRLTGKI